MRKLVSDQTYPAGKQQYKPEWNNYWGNTSASAWDVLYLGHCGDIFKPSSWSFRIPRVMYEDTTLPHGRKCILTARSSSRASMFRRTRA